jgi:hypothetical protein
MQLRRPLTAALALLSLLGAARTQAQTTTPTPTTPTTASFTKDDFTIRIQRKASDGTWVFLPDIEAQRYFNGARCQCKTPIKITVDFSPAGFQKRGAIGTDPNGPSAQGNMQLWVGPSGCLDPQKSVRLGALCRDLSENKGPLLSALGLQAPPAWTVDATVNDLFVVNGKEGGGSCDQAFSQKIWLWLPSNSGDAPFLTSDAAPQLNVAVDGSPPGAPLGVVVTSGNEALNVSWSRVTGLPDLNGYVVFCSRAGLPVFKDTFFSGNEFHTEQTECKMGDLSTPGVGSATSTDPAHGTAIDAPPEIHNVNSAFACSPLMTSATTRRIATLQNGINYAVGVAAVDRMGNISPVATAYVQHPVLTRDFYSAYRSDGGAAEGGFCTYGRRGRPAGWAVAGAGLLLALGLRARRRS